MLWRQLDKRELSAEPDPARTGCVQAGLTHSEKKKGGQASGRKVCGQARDKRRCCVYRICEDGQRMYREIKNSSGSGNFRVRCSSVVFPLCKPRYKVNRTVCIAIT